MCRILTPNSKREPKLQNPANYQDPVHAGCTTNCLQAPSAAMHMDDHAIRETDAKILIVLRQNEGTPMLQVVMS